MSVETFLAGAEGPRPPDSSDVPATATAAEANASTPAIAPQSPATKGSGGPAPSWVSALPEDARGYVENKGWKEPGDVLKGYRQLEEFLGADKAGRGVLLPKDEKDKEALDKIYAALGRPEKAEGYELTELLAKEETDPAFMSAMAETMHGAGLSRSQAHKLATAYQAHFKAGRQAAVEAHQQEVAEAARTLSPEEKEHCQRGFRFLELSKQEAAVIEMYWGVAKAARMFARIGKALGEDKRVDGTTPASFGGSPDAAKSRIAELQADANFRQRYLDGEPEARRVMDELYVRASGA